MFPTDFLKEHRYMRSFIESKASWQVMLGLGVIIGAYSTGVPPPASVPALEAFFGGFLILFGARFVGGCASGHGLSGLAILSVTSWITVPFIFLGGFLMGHLLKFTLTQYSLGT
jgi:uncharacterized membrane protein YedE/YeeE